MNIKHREKTKNLQPIGDGDGNKYVFLDAPSTFLCFNRFYPCIGYHISYSQIFLREKDYVALSRLPFPIYPLDGHRLHVTISIKLEL
jgi:hypothetical protein